ncbi:hypothetical protein Ac2012v2_003477 [Leucoagaricus gongylophorus]
MPLVGIDDMRASVPVHTLLSKFIDTRHFQRLHDVKQLGTSHFVWPGATHTRFEHSLGIEDKIYPRRTHGFVP